MNRALTLENYKYMNNLFESKTEFKSRFNPKQFESKTYNNVLNFHFS